MTFEDYQKKAMSTNKDHSKGVQLNEKNSIILESAMGLAGEAGEVADLVKKVVFHGHLLDTKELTKEIGDILWYIAEMCYALDISMNTVADINLEKLAKRYPGGFSSEASINREE